MKPMLDKDFDAFFKSSFEDFEVAAATDSWNKISDKITVKPVKKTTPFFWMAAASIIIVLGVGIGMYTTPTALIKLHPDEKSEMMANLTQQQNGNEFVEPAEKIAVKKKRVQLAKTQVVSDKLIAQENLNEADAQPGNDEPVNTELKSVKILRPIRTKLATERLIEQEEFTRIRKVNPETLAQAEYEAGISSAVANTRSGLPKISSVGDLVNFVIAKVDKRDEKLIKMSRTEESDNEITGINLGLFKFRKLD